MTETANIVAIRYLKQSGEYIVTTRNAATGKTSKTYANTLTDNERSWAKSSKHRFEDAMSVCWIN